jgi:glutamate/tyrosine decarboxylase-like PLP-dependent enzyme
MVDEMFDHLAGQADGPVWRKMPAELRAELRAPLPRGPSDPETAYQQFRRLVLPYATGNLHPGFMGWVHGGGTAIGMLAELLAGGLNANLGGRDHAPIEVERQVIAWAAEMLGFPPTAAGILVTGTSMANLIGVLTARTDRLGPVVRQAGLGDARLTAYCATTAHGCIPRAMEIAGLGRDALRMVPCDTAGRIRLDALARAVMQDRREGATPFLVVGTAGTVDIGAVDDLAGLAAFCEREDIWFHVDAAFGAIAMLAPRLRPLLRGIEQADSVGFDFHKWAQVPYDAGCFVTRDPAVLLAAFAGDAAYLRRESRGLAGGGIWPCDLGPDLSRGFRALKVWLTLMVYGADAIGAMVQQSCDLAQRLAARIDAAQELERLAPVALNIVCFRYCGAGPGLDALNAAIVADLHEDGVAAPSSTVLDGQLAIRAAIVNHRTGPEDVDRLVDAVLARGRARSARAA